MATPTTPEGLIALVVDDDPVARGAFCEIYQRAGMRAVGVGDAPAALVALGENPVDLCLVDLILPSTSGLELIEGIRRRLELGKVSAIAITARRDPALLGAAFDLGADDFLFKPVMPEELVARSKAAVRRRREGGRLSDLRSSRRCDLTSLFCDVRGFTAVAASLDPEWVVEILNGVFDRLVHQVDDRGGVVDKFLGDGLLAYFGLGRKEEKELLAVDAALAMVESIDAYSKESLLLAGRSLQVGVGIASGTVVVAPVGAIRQRQTTAIGDSVNLAARLEGIAGEGEVLICPTTYERIGARISTGPGRVVELKGVAGQPSVYPVTGLKPR